jgi:hypothetical protein
MTKSPAPLTIEADNLSLCWGAVLDRLAGPGGGEISPLTLSITGFNDVGEVPERPPIRTALDALLAAEGKRDVENVAFDFPGALSQAGPWGPG